jgi:hypothetical protein
MLQDEYVADWRMLGTSSSEDARIWFSPNKTGNLGQ